MTGHSFLRVILDLGIFLLLGFTPLLFIMWYWSDRRLTTRQWTVITGIVFVASLMAHIAVISVLSGIVMCAFGIAWLWHRAILVDVGYERSFGQTHLFPGETTDVTWTMNNDKPLPISWLRWQEGIPVRPFGGLQERHGLELADVDIRAVLEGAAEGLDEVTSLSAFQTLIKTVRVKALRRGYYQFGPTLWEASDALGLHTASREITDRSAITVYPRLYQPAELGVPTRALLGDIRRRQSLVEDPIWYRGAREYLPGDPMKTIDWRTSARTSRLHVKTFDPTVHPKLMLVANLHAFEKISEGVITEYMEDVISTSASIASWALEAGYEVGIHSNGALPGTHIPVRIPPSAGENQLFIILDYLAKIMLIIDRHIENLIRADLEDLPFGATVMVCSNVCTQGMMDALTDGARTKRMVLVLVDNDSSFSIPGVEIAHVHSRSREAA